MSRPMKDTTQSTPAIAKRRLGNTGLELSELGLGTAALGNLYHSFSDAQAQRMLSSALAAGVSYIDTAPLYGYGLSERRVGDAVRGRSDVVVSTKVGRMLVPVREIRDDSERRGFFSALPFEPKFDYGYDAVMRSYEDSLQRLGLASVDILFVHDIGPFTHAARHEEFYRQLMTQGGLRALEELRAARQISAIGIGVNEIPICLQLMGEARLDIILLAGRYTLLEQQPLDELFPACRRNGVRIVAGGPYNSGILATGTRSGGTLHHDYVAAPAAVIDRVRSIEAICDRHRVDLPAAALQFVLANPDVISVIPGLDTPERVADTLRYHRAAIAPDFWAELRSAGPIRADAPTPGSAAQ
jgi:D-threo-aldose 1-dehydrogenase